MALSLGACFALGWGSGAQGFEPEGAWYVLVHYEDEAGAAWQDRVWVFEERGSRLVWTEYPVVVLRDDRGRSEALPSGRTVRSAGHWRPRGGQREEIAGGVGVASVWARSKTLRAAGPEGYRSHGAVRPESTSVLGYSERWEIDTAGPLATFRRRDELSGGRAEALAGLTEYRATKQDPDAIEGEFVRDSMPGGRFRMWRVAPPRPVSGEGDSEAPEAPGR